MFYLELFNDVGISIKHIATILIDCIDWCLVQEEIPGATEKECGNYKSHNLCKAKEWLAMYKDILNETYMI